VRALCERDEMPSQSSTRSGRITAAGGYGFCGMASRATIASSMAAIFNLNHPAHTLHWHFFTMSFQ
jgi:hypothetical protein